MSGVIGTLAGIGMAIGPPLIYVDQAYSIYRKKDSSGFSWDVCGVILIANIIRIFFWLGNRFELPLLAQSILLILAHLFLLSLCLYYAPQSQNHQEVFYAPLSPVPSPSRATKKPPNSKLDSTSEPETDALDELDLNEEGDYSDDRERTRNHSLEQGGPLSGNGAGSSLENGNGGFGSTSGRGSWKNGTRRPFDFWQWEGVGTYLEVLAGLVVVLGVLQVSLGWWTWYIDALGFVALTIESTLPIPQFISNYRRKSTYGLRASTLAGWTFGDVFKTGYFFIRGAPLQFKVTAIMTVCFDLAVVSQRFLYGTDPPVGIASVEGDEEARGLHSGSGPSAER